MPDSYNVTVIKTRLSKCLIEISRHRTYPISHVIWRHVFAKTMFSHIDTLVTMWEVKLVSWKWHTSWFKTHKSYKPLKTIQILSYNVAKGNSIGQMEAKLLKHLHVFQFHSISKWEDLKNIQSFNHFTIKSKDAPATSHESYYRRHIRSDLGLWPKLKYNLVSIFLDQIDWKIIFITNVGADIKWPLNLPVFLRLQLHDWGHGRNSAMERGWKYGKCLEIQILCQYDDITTQTTHLHGLHGIIPIIMNRLPLALWVRVSKTGNMDHITVVEGNKHSEDTRSRMHRLLGRNAT